MGCFVSLFLLIAGIASFVTGVVSVNIGWPNESGLWYLMPIGAVVFVVGAIIGFLTQLDDPDRTEGGDVTIGEQIGCFFGMGWFTSFVALLGIGIQQIYKLCTHQWTNPLNEEFFAETIIAMVIVQVVGALALWVFFIAKKDTIFYKIGFVICVLFLAGVIIAVTGGAIIIVLIFVPIILLFIISTIKAVIEAIFG